MKYFVLNTFFVLVVSYTAAICVVAAEETYLFNFNGIDDVSNWTEQSDTVRPTGMSEATITLSSNITSSRAVFFALLNPQSDGSGFAGVRILESWNISDYSNLQIQCRGQGQYSGFKVNLRHKGLIYDANVTYDQFFTAPSIFSVVTLPLSDFKPYFRGQEITDGEALDTSDVSAFGLQFYGGVYENVTQNGPATLEIDWIKAVV